MYTVSVRDHFMIAHSFQGEVFGPAQALHGATYVVDWEVRAQQLNADGIVMDIGRACDMLKAVLNDLNFKNLDDVSEFKGKNTTTEFMAKTIFDRLEAGVSAGSLGSDVKGLDSMRVGLHESHIAWASYEAPVSF